MHRPVPQSPKEVKLFDVKKGAMPESTTAGRQTKTKAPPPTDSIYQNLVEATSDSIYVVDQNCRYLYVNPKHCKRIGLQPEQIIGRNYREFHSSDEIKTFSADVDKVFRSGLSFQRQYSSRRDGDEFLRTFSPVRTPPASGEITAVSVISKNISEWKLAEHLYATLAEKSPIGIFIVQNRRFCWSNRRFLENTGYTSEDILDEDSLFMVHPDDREHVRQSARAMMKGKSVSPYEYRVVTKQGHIRWYVGTVTSIEYKYQPATLGCQMDISLQKSAEDELKQSEERSRTIIDSITDAYYEVDLRGNLLLFNDALLKIFGYRQEEMAGISYKKHVTKKNAAIAFRAFSQVYKTGTPLTKMEWQVIHKTGETRHLELSVSLTRNAAGQPKGFRGIMSDVTARRKKDETIRRQAFHDSLTNLANRLLFNDRLTMAIKRAKRASKRVAVMMLDLDYFKNVNDGWGHATGDRLLKEVADRLEVQVRDTDTVARQGGDEFSIALSPIHSTDEAQRIAAKIVSSFYEPFHLENTDLNVTVSVGISLYPDHGDNLDILINKADKAMYEAKNHGRNRYCLYEDKDQT